jgi:hypothetical protein
LLPTENRRYHLLRLRVEVDSLTFAYTNLKRRNDRWNQYIMLITSLGALITSVMTIAEFVGWPFEIVPIIIQTIAGMMAGWMRFYDFPKRMEAIINAKHSTNDTRERLERSQAIDEAMWDQICSAARMVDAVLTPNEREVAHKAAIKYQGNEAKREAKLHKLLAMGAEQLLALKDAGEDTTYEQSPKRGFLDVFGYGSASEVNRRTTESSSDDSPRPRLNVVGKPNTRKEKVVHDEDQVGLDIESIPLKDAVATERLAGLGTQAEEDSSVTQSDKGGTGEDEAGSDPI